MDQAGSTSSKMAWRAPGALSIKNYLWNFLQATLDIHQHSSGQNPHPQGDFSPFSPSGLKFGSGQRGSRTGWFKAQPKLPSQIPRVHQEGFMHSLTCDPCGCPQKTLRASCVIVPREVLMATSAQKSTRENSLDSLSTGNAQFDGAASELVQP